MEDQAVIKRAFHFLPGPRIGEFLGAFGEADEILDGFRGFFFEQTGDNRALRCIEYSVRAWCAAHMFLLDANIRLALSPIPPAEASALDGEALNS
jgi:hypothetical protein